MPLPERVVLPLIFRLGEMIPLVSTGTHVQAGQIVARGSDKSIPPLLASITGRVSAVQSWPTPNGDQEQSLVIDSTEKAVPDKEDEETATDDACDARR